MRFGKKYDDDELDMTGFEKEKSLLVKMFEDEDQRSSRIKYAILGLVLFLVFSYISGWIVRLQDAMEMGISNAIGLPFWKYYLSAFFSFRGWLYTILMCAVVGGVFYYLIHREDELSTIKESDARGVNYSQKGTYGTAEWMTRKEAKGIYEIGPIDEVSGVILAQYSEKGKETICLPTYTQGNRNILILGSPGSGKSFCYVRNAIFQACVRKESVVITDPKGELYESTSELLRQRGYKVWVYNLVDPMRSDAWNCLSEIYSPETGNVSDIRVTEFADTVMKNTTDGPDDHFWGTGESNLFKAIIMYCSWKKETELIGIYEQEARRLVNSIPNRIEEKKEERLLEILTSPESFVTMNERKRALELLAKLSPDVDNVEEYMDSLDREAPPCDLASIYYMLVTDDIGKLEEKFKAVPISHPAGISWSIFKNGAENVRPGIVQGLAQRLQLFQSRDIRRIVVNKGIDFAKLGEEKIALFCIISDKSTAMRALTSLFFSFLFKDVADAADKYGPDTRIPVNVICDEFANLGVIPSFDVTISTVRSRKINISIILQSIKQLEKNYAEAASTISSCCDTVLFLGCNDMETAEYISELSGIATIRSNSTRDNRMTSLGNRGMMQGYAISEGDGKRNLLNPDEVRRLPKGHVVLYHKGCNILQAHSCGYIEHRFFKQGDIPTVALREYPLASEKYSLTEHLDSFLQGDLSNMAAKNRAVSQEKTNRSITNSKPNNIISHGDAGFDRIV